MLNDLDLIVKTYPNTKEWNTLRVYALGDVHVGAPNFNEQAIKKKIEIIKNDKHCAVVLCGDLADYGLRNSKTNIYQSTLSVREQQRYVLDLFSPIKDKISVCVPGNHEERITREVGTCPMYDMCVLWGIPEVYRENVAITKYAFGSQRGKKQRIVFYGITSHGASKNRHHKFVSASFEGQDFAISGHVHEPSYSPHGRIRIERNGTVHHVPYKEIVVDANLSPGGYAMKKEYEVAPPPELQYLELSATFDPKTRQMNRIMNYHSIQI